ncbi:MAG: response regulator [Arcobacteraceae bacterium]
MFKVLIIEDEPLIALNLKIILEKKGFEVTGCAANYKDAQELFCANKPDIVLCDIKLENNESGIEIVINLKNINDFQVIYLSSYSNDVMIDKAIQTNPISYITKPFKESDLSAAFKLATLPLKNKNILYNFYYITQTQILFYKNEHIVLSKQESELFHICYLSKGFFVPMHTIEYYIWGEETISNSTKRGLIHRLKKKLNDNVFSYCSGLGCKVDNIL